MPKSKWDDDEEPTMINFYTLITAMFESRMTQVEN